MNVMTIKSIIETKIRNYSNLSHEDCMMKLTSDIPLETMTIDDLDEIYVNVFGRYAYHMSREGYIKALYKKRLKLNETLCTMKIQ
ncbi:MAG: hypothetical protein M0R17_08665 [Candidatus Omnitrophica bacterium]|nr:hypothetical protein [Candidatus Omnitrophota bacterium]